MHILTYETGTITEKQGNMTKFSSLGANIALYWVFPRVRILKCLKASCAFSTARQNGQKDARKTHENACYTV